MERDPVDMISPILERENGLDSLLKKRFRAGVSPRRLKPALKTRRPSQR